jgi:two-component system, sensor histidine kinase and response regulator
MGIESPKKFKILVVDDNMENIQVIGNLLTEQYSLGIAFNGQQALSSLQMTNDYDLVLLDLDMPVMNGYETCKTIREDNKLKDIPVIFLTAAGDMENMLMAYHMGAQDYITKPFHSWELEARIKTQLLLKQKTDLVKEFAVELVRLNATKDKFFSIIAHDLRNPFAGLRISIQGILKNLRAMDLDELEKDIQELYETTKRSGELLENLLEWSTSQRGKIKYMPVDLNLKAMAEECIGLVRPQTEVKKIMMRNEIPDDLVIRTDKNILKTIFRNLLTNAVKFTFTGGTITIRSAMKKDFIEISVIDTGTGMSEKTRDRLFKLKTMNVQNRAHKMKQEQDWD